MYGDDRKQAQDKQPDKPSLRLLVNDNAPAPQHGRRVGVVRRIHLVVVHQPAAIAPNPDAELVYSTTFVLRSDPCHNQPIVAGAGEVELARFELELGVPLGQSHPAYTSRQSRSSGHRLQTWRSVHLIDIPTKFRRGRPPAELFLAKLSTDNPTELQQSDDRRHH